MNAYTKIETMISILILLVAFLDNTVMVAIAINYSREKFNCK